MHTHFLYMLHAVVQLVKKALICILLLTWRDTKRATEWESVCVNQCNGAKTSVALKREQTCGGQDVFFFFSFHAQKQQNSTSVTAGHTIAPTVRQEERERNIKGSKGRRMTEMKNDRVTSTQHFQRWGNYLFRVFFSFCSALFLSVITLSFHQH